MSEEKTAHPKGLYLLFATEMWERFNFYGMRAILSLFLIEALAFKQSEASVIYGGFLGLCYLTPMIGGFVSDRFLGNRNCILLGGIVMAVGQMLLFASASLFTTNLDLAHTVTWIALGTIILGNGFFKPNISSMVGQLYPKGSNKLDSAFTIFYMGINLGALIGNSICSVVGDVKHDGVRDVTAFKWGFLAASIAMVVGTLIFLFLKNKYVITPDGEAIGAKPVKSKTVGENAGAKFTSTATGIAAILSISLMALFHYAIGVNWIYSLIYSSGLCLAGLILSDKSLTKEERDRIWVIYMVGFFVIFFWACFEQAGSSLTYIADHRTDTHIFGWEMPPTLVQNANSLFIIIFAPIFSLVWIALARKNREPISPVKQSLGLLLLSIGYFIIAFQVKKLTGDSKLGVSWLILMYLFHTLGELCLSPIGLSLVAKLAPLRFSSLLMGVFFLSNASGYALAGTLGALIPPDVAVSKVINAKEFNYVVVPAHDTIPEQAINVKNDSSYIVSNFKEPNTPTEYYSANFDVNIPAGEKDSILFLKPGIATWSFDSATVKTSKGEDSLVLKGLKNSFAGNKFSIPLYKFKQILNVYEIKPVAAAGGNQAKLDSIWKAGASERLSQYTFSADGKSLAVWSKGKLKLWDLDPPKPTFAGFTIHNLFEFFMIFVLLPGVAAVLLYLLSFKLKKMMHGVR